MGAQLKVEFVVSRLAKDSKTLTRNASSKVQCLFLAQIKACTDFNHGLFVLRHFFTERRGDSGLQALESAAVFSILRFLRRVIKWPFRNAKIPTSPLARTL